MVAVGGTLAYQQLVAAADWVVDCAPTIADAPAPTFCAAKVFAAAGVM